MIVHCLVTWLALIRFVEDPSKNVQFIFYNLPYLSRVDHGEVPASGVPRLSSAALDEVPVSDGLPLWAHAGDAAVGHAVGLSVGHPAGPCIGHPAGHPAGPVVVPAAAASGSCSGDSGASCRHGQNLLLP